MENLRQIAAPQSAGSSAAKALSAKRLDVQLKLQIGKMLEHLAARWSAQEEHPDSAMMRQMAMEELAAEFSLANLEQALRWFITRTQWFPDPKLIRDRLEEMKRREQKELFKSLPTIGCADCRRDDGVHPPIDGVVWVTDGLYSSVKDCRCVIALREARLRALEAPAKPAKREGM